MPSRSFKQYLLVTAKGLAMGAADVVPGVSGGTIAFISGIYQELIETIHKLDLGFFKICKKESLNEAWKKYNINFLVSLFGGIAISILSLAKIITSLLSEYPILVWSFFFGLVVASIIYVGRQITQFNIRVIISLLIAAVLSYFITLAEPVGDTQSTWFLFIAGFIAIIAMILPGISGAFILLLLGAYTTVLGTITQFSDGLLKLDWTMIWDAFLKLLIFAVGAVVGLKVFSGVLNWMFKNYKNSTLAILTGFMIGALNKIWPWKEIETFRINSHGKKVPLLEHSILPSSYDGEPLILYAVLFMIIGFLVIFLLEYLAVSKKPAK
jgi:putative membrane protein